MEDREITARIGELVDEEHKLERAHVGQVLNDDEQARMRALGVELDRCWDLLRQRRARREMGQDPADVAPRPRRPVAHYQQ